VAKHGASITDDMLRKLAESFDHNAKGLLKHQSVPGYPTFEELKAARERGPEALAELLAKRVPRAACRNRCRGCGSRLDLVCRRISQTRSQSGGDWVLTVLPPLAAAKRHGEKFNRLSVAQSGLQKIGACPARAQQLAIFKRARLIPARTETATVKLSRTPGYLRAQQVGGGCCARAGHAPEQKALSPFDEERAVVTRAARPWGYGYGELQRNR